MEYKNSQVAQAAKKLMAELEIAKDKKSVLRSPLFGALYEQLKTMPQDDRASFGAEINLLKKTIEDSINGSDDSLSARSPIDVTAPFDINCDSKSKPELLSAENGSQHPLSTELKKVLDIFYRMGFTVVESREIDDDYHMFTSLNFPADHPARDDYDTFITDEGLIAPAHTSTMQNRVIAKYAKNLKNGKPIAVVLPGRVFRNEDLDARHEHTFHQFEGVFVGEAVNTGNLLATFKTFLQTYYDQEVEIKTQPLYFPFTEPSFELALSCPFCQKAGCHVCSQTGWIELLGMGMIHPNVLKEAGVDPNVYTGFAWGCGLERLVMMKYGIEDIRHFHSGNLKFLRQFR